MLNIDNGRSLTLANGTLVNNGQMTLNSTGGATNLILNGASTISGTGTITLGNDPNNSIRAGGAADVITQTAGHTIQGSGQILLNLGGFVNQGTIIASNATNALTIDPGAGNFDNSGGTLRATGGGTLSLAGATYTNTAGTLEALGTNSAVSLDTASLAVIGGELSSSGGGAIRTNVTATGALLDGVRLTTGSDLILDTANYIRVTNGFVNDGTISMNSTGASTNLQFVGTQSITGTGEILMSDNIENQITTNAATDVITLGEGQEIRGTGRVLLNSGGLVSDGVIRQQGATQMVIDPGSVDAGGGANFINNGTLRAEGTGGIRLDQGVYQNNTVMEVADGSNLTFNSAGTVILGGDLTTAGTGEIRTNVTATGALLDGVRLTTGSKMVSANGADIRITNGFTNNGLVEMNSTGGVTELRFVGTQTIDGTGEIVMSDNAGNQIIANGSTDILTLGANQVLRGTGQLLANSGALINNGTILQQGTTKLVFDPGSVDAGGGANFINNGTFRAEGTGGISLGGGLYQNNTAMVAADGSNITLASSGTVIRGGDLTTLGSGAIRTNVTSIGAVLDGVRLTTGSNLILDNFQDIRIQNGFVNDGTVSMNSTGGVNELRFVGTQTLSGNGQIVMSDNLENRIVANGSTDVLTVGAGQTIRGAGRVLLNSGGITNQGTFIADATNNAMTIDGGTATFTNFGTVRASGAAGLSISGIGNQFIQAGGLVDVQAASQMAVVGGNYRQTGGLTAVNGLMSVTGSSSGILLEGGRFGGTGNVTFSGAGAHTLNNTGGTLAAGNSPGNLTLTGGDYIQTVGAAFEYELFGAIAGVSHDLLTIFNGDADLGGAINVLADALFASTLSIGDRFEVVRLDIGGLFLNGDFFDTLTVNLAGLDFIQVFDVNGLGGQSLFLEVVQADVPPPGAVPEPRMMALMLLGLALLALSRRRPARRRA